MNKGSFCSILARELILSCLEGQGCLITTTFIIAFSDTYRKELAFENQVVAKILIFDQVFSDITSGGRKEHLLSKQKPRLLILSPLTQCVWEGLVNCKRMKVSAPYLIFFGTAPVGSEAGSYRLMRVEVQALPLIFVHVDAGRPTGLFLILSGVK